MKIEFGCAALVTGAGSGIGRALAVALARRGASVTIVDFLEQNAHETLELVKQEHAKLQGGHPVAIFAKCDVTKHDEIAQAFREHDSTFQRLDVCINCAGIGGSGDFLKDDKSEWKRVIDVNFTGVVECTRWAVKLMRARKQPGVIINLASASGLYPAPQMPVYSGSKGGVVLFSRSLGRLRKEGIRVNVLCPEFVDTPMVKTLHKSIIDVTDGFISMDKVIEGTFVLVEDDTKAGACLWITNRRGTEYWPGPEEKAKYLAVDRSSRRRRAFKGRPGVSSNLPTSYQKVIVHTLSSNFRLATRLVTAQLPTFVKESHVLIRYLYAGINASDVNYSSGRYFGSETEALKRLPFDAGFEAVGIVVGVGDGVDVEELQLGCSAATMSYGGFTEFAEVPLKYVIPVPAATPEVIGILVSGLTASIALEESGRMGSGETVLVTAAAGGTGQFAVQLAKLAGNKVIATCGGSDKAQLLASLGVDRVIDYRKEDIKTVLKQEYPRGVDLVYESVGGEMFNTCLGALAKFGRLIIIGMISQYQGPQGWQPANYPGLCEKLLWKSQTLVGFFLMNHSKQWKEQVEKLHKLHLSGKLKVAIDPKPFVGLNSVPDAVDYLHSGRSVGKVVVKIGPSSRL